MRKSRPLWWGDAAPSSLHLGNTYGEEWLFGRLPALKPPPVFFLSLLPSSLSRSVWSSQLVIQSVSLVVTSVALPGIVVLIIVILEPFLRLGLILG